MDPRILESITVWRDPLGYPWSTYLWVIAVACVAGAVKHVNRMQRFSMGRLMIDVLTAAFMGVLTFWVCEAYGVKGPMQAVSIAVIGAMGNRAWREFENIWRIKIGLKPTEVTDDESR